MKQKENLKKKAIPSLLTVSILCALYSTDALAVSINGKNQTDLNLTQNGAGQYIIDYDALENNAKSHKFVIAQGDKVIITKPGNAGLLISEIKKASGDLTKIRDALAKYSVVGVVGGEGQLDVGLTGVLDALNNEDLQSLLQWLGIDVNSITGITNKIIAIDTANNNHAVYNEGTDITIGDENNSTVAIGVVSGDLSFNTGLVPKGTILPIFASDKGEPTSIERSGDAVLNINNGNVFGGIGGSAAISVGNIEASFDSGDSAPSNPDTNGIFSLNGETYVTLKGDVKTTIGTNANAAGIFNGGMAMAVGGIAESTIVGSTNLAVKSSVELGTAINGLTVGLSGGGAALTTIGGTANSTVQGSTNIGVNNGLTLGLIGGGVAGAFDATGAVEAVSDKLPDDIFSDIGDQIGKNDGSSETTIKNIITVTVNDAIQGGTATADTKDTNITLTGNTTAIGVIGGGVAAASHTYTVRPEDEGGSLPEGYEVNDAFGNSSATSSSGKANITVNLNSADPDNVAANIGCALSGIISAVKDGNLDKIGDINSIAGQGAVVGVFGGGVAFGQGSLRGTIKDSDPQGALASVTNTGADIKLLNGYAAGVFGGGAAGALNNARAQTSTGTVNTYIGTDMKAVGVFGGGFALSMEGEKGPDRHKGNTSGILSNSKVDSNNIEVYGDVDGIYGGGMAIGNSVLNANTENQIDAQTHVGSSTITVNSGTIDRLQLISIMEASKNDNEDGYPQWNRLGLNASMAMVDLRGITDNTSIAAGGMALGMSGSDIVDTANITINGGIITRDILGGGIAVELKAAVPMWVKAI